MRPSEDGYGSNTRHGPSDPLFGTGYLDYHMFEYKASAVAVELSTDNEGSHTSKTIGEGHFNRVGN